MHVETGIIPRGTTLIAFNHVVKNLLIELNQVLRR